MTASRSSHTDRLSTNSLPRASVVIPTYNRCATLARVLGGLSCQTIAPDTFEVIVVADGCTDGTDDLCRRLAGELPFHLRLFEQANAGPAAARDRAVREARASLIVFVDDDVVPDEHLIAVHLAAHAPDGDDMVVAMGPLLPPLDQRLNVWGAWEERALCAQYDDMQAGRWQPTYRQFYTGNASLARQLILDAGGFNASYRRAEDVELGLRLAARGCHFVFLPQARGWHYVHRSFASWAHMPVAYGQACVAMGRAHRIQEVVLAATEYYQRNILVRAIAALCLGSSWRVKVATNILGALAVASWAARIPILPFLCCSLIYNLRYYVGMAEQLGGAGIFWQLIAAARPVGKTHNSPHAQELQNRAYQALLQVTTQVLGNPERLEQVEVGASG
ncbi:MAG: glycosyltransferase [Ktedonobacterales bacterium]